MRNFFRWGDGNTYFYRLRLELTLAGVPLRKFQAQVGASLGETRAQDRLITPVLVGGEDCYRVVFSLAELNAGCGNQKMLMADEVRGWNSSRSPAQGIWWCPATAVTGAGCAR